MNALKGLFIFASTWKMKLKVRRANLGRLLAMFKKISLHTVLFGLRILKRLDELWLSDTSTSLRYWNYPWIFSILLKLADWLTEKALRLLKRCQWEPLLISFFIMPFFARNRILIRFRCVLRCIWIENSHYRVVFHEHGDLIGAHESHWLTLFRDNFINSIVGSILIELYRLHTVRRN
jgi:hypothetical protein